MNKVSFEIQEDSQELAEVHNSNIAKWLNWIFNESRLSVYLTREEKEMPKMAISVKKENLLISDADYYDVNQTTLLSDNQLSALLNAVSTGKYKYEFGNIEIYPHIEA